MNLTRIIKTNHLKIASMIVTTLDRHTTQNIIGITIPITIIIIIENINNHTPQISNNLVNMINISISRLSMMGMDILT